MRFLRSSAILAAVVSVALPMTPANAKHEHGVTLVIGDSITFRSRHELQAKRPAFEIEGRPGSNANSLKSRLAAYLEDHPAPRKLVIALGSNGFHTTENDYTRAIDLLPKSTVVALVSAWRNPAIWGRARSLIVWHNTEFMLDIARTRPSTCMINWRPTVVAHPGLLVDGLHPTVPHGERVWAKTVAQGSKACT